MYALLFSLRLQSYNFFISLQGGALSRFLAPFVAICNFLCFNF
jgi:hypothetical protein